MHIYVRRKYWYMLICEPAYSLANDDDRAKFVLSEQLSEIDIVADACVNMCGRDVDCGMLMRDAAHRKVNTCMHTHVYTYVYALPAAQLLAESTTILITLQMVHLCVCTRICTITRQALKCGCPLYNAYRI